MKSAAGEGAGRRLLSIALALGCLAAPAARAAEAAGVNSATPNDRPATHSAAPAAWDPTSAYQEQELEGWRVLVNHKLLADKELCAATLGLLSRQLQQVTRAVPEEALSKLRQIPIWVERSSSQFPCMCYHESRGWLETHGVNPDKAGAVELANPTNFLSWIHQQPWMVLHELAHGYHQRVLGDNYAGIERCYEQAKAARIYESVLRNNGRHERHYALTNSKEYFAEMTEAFFGTNDFYPFMRTELRDYDPQMFVVLGQVWGVAHATEPESPLRLAVRTAAPEFRPGQVWCDAEGQPIDAHGGGILSDKGVYYWYGEGRGPRARGGVACYASTNLLDWNWAGRVLPQARLPRANGRGTFVERPKVIFNARTHKFVMWMHLEQPGYRFAQAGVALSDSPTNTFTFLQTLRPIPNTNDFTALTNDSTHQKEFGGTFRDMNLFVDDDGRAYVFYASEDNWTMYVVRLNEDFTGPAEPAVENQTWARILVGRMREGVAPFKHGGKYYLITSACTGWKANTADCAVADHILGPYRSLGNPCRGPEAETTFGAQSTFVLPVADSQQQLIFMADRWNAAELQDSRYVWLPITFDAQGAPLVNWCERWALPRGEPGRRAEATQ